MKLNTNPILLSLETSTHLCSVVLSKGKETLALKEQSSEKYTHAESLHPFIDQVLQNSGLNYSDLDAIAVGLGPGSYTGLRIGVSAAKGLAFALDIPILSINSLFALGIASVHTNENFLHAPMIDARRSEVYTMLMNPVGKELISTSAIILDETFLSNYKPESIIISGDAALKAQEHLKSKNFAYDMELKHSAVNLIRPALKTYENQNFADTAYFEPYYLKEFIAQKPKNQFKKA